MAEGDAGSRDERSRSGYVPTSPAVSESPAEELPMVPLDLRRPPAPPSSHAQGSVTGPSPFSVEEHSSPER